MTDWRDELREFLAANAVEPAKTLGELVTLLPPPTSEDIARALAELTNPRFAGRSIEGAGDIIFATSNLPENGDE